MLKLIKYEDLNSRQKANYNYQKVASELADYGFNCMWLNDDWQLTQPAKLRFPFSGI